MSRFQIRLYLLESPVFIGCIAVLLCNDFILKELYPGFITGKLSDVVGIGALFLFLTATTTFSTRNLSWLLGIAFFFWKSIYSEPLIVWWNALGIFPIVRTPDLSDCGTLIALLWFAAYARSYRKSPTNFAKAFAVGVVAMFAFGATSKVTRIPQEERDRLAAIREEYYSEYNFVPGWFHGERVRLSLPISRAAILSRLNAGPDSATESFYLEPPIGWTLSLHARSSICFDVRDETTAPNVLPQSFSHVPLRSHAERRLRHFLSYALMESEDTPSGAILELRTLNLCDGPQRITKEDAVEHLRLFLSETLKVPVFRIAMP